MTSRNGSRPRRQAPVSKSDPQLTPRIRLLKVIVQPVVVVDDGQTLVERTSQPQEISPADFPDYPKQLLAQIDQLNSSPDQSVTPPEKPSTVRRSK